MSVDLIKSNIIFNVFGNDDLSLIVHWQMKYLTVNFFSLFYVPQKHVLHKNGLQSVISIENEIAIENPLNDANDSKFTPFFNNN